MSFSSQIKDELSRQMSPARHCQIAEIAAILGFCGHVHMDEENCFSIRIHTENVSVARKYFTLLKKAFNIGADISIRRNAFLKKNRTYTVLIREHEPSVRILEAARLLDGQGEICENLSAVRNTVLQNPCCRRAFIRGAFLAAGSLSDPEKFYHFEIVCASKERASQHREVIATFSIDAKIVVRKKYFVVYIKEGSQIVEVLAVMEARLALMELENIRILKEMRNSVNRQVNCETANINKTVSAAVRQLSDITYIRDTVGLSYLPEALAGIAQIRLDKPEATLKELGESLSPPVGKSGVNHRLRRISAIAETLRNGSDTSAHLLR